MWKCAKQSTFYYLEIRWQCRFQQKWKKYWTKMLLKELRPKMPAGYYYHFLNLATRWDWMCKSEEESEKHKKQSDLEWINLILVIHGYNCTLCFMSHFFFCIQMNNYSPKIPTLNPACKCITTTNCNNSTNSAKGQSQVFALSCMKLVHIHHNHWFIYQ